LNSQAFQTPIEYLKGVGLARAEVLKKELQIFTFEDLLKHFPYKYIDRTRFYKIKDIQPDMPYVQVLARLVSKEIMGENTPNAWLPSQGRYRHYRVGVVPKD
jgi:ATP-dependent DNA helicase RecG